MVNYPDCFHNEAQVVPKSQIAPLQVQQISSRIPANRRVTYLMRDRKKFILFIKKLRTPAWQSHVQPCASRKRRTPAIDAAGSRKWPFTHDELPGTIEINFERQQSCLIGYGCPAAGKSTARNKTPSDNPAFAHIPASDLRPLLPPPYPSAMPGYTACQDTYVNSTRASKREMV